MQRPTRRGLPRWTTDESQGVGGEDFGDVIGRAEVAEAVRSSPVAPIWAGLSLDRAFCAVIAQHRLSPGVAAPDVRR